MFEQLNAQGGVDGRRVDIRALNDGDEPNRCAANTHTPLQGEGRVRT